MWDQSIHLLSYVENGSKANGLQKELKKKKKEEVVTKNKRQEHESRLGREKKIQLGGGGGGLGSEKKTIQKKDGKRLQMPNKTKT